jgi:hypothetical protein
MLPFPAGNIFLHEISSFNNEKAPKPLPYVRLLHTPKVCRKEIREASGGKTGNLISLSFGSRRKNIQKSLAIARFSRVGEIYLDESW